MLLKHSPKAKWLKDSADAGALTLKSDRIMEWICRSPECRKVYCSSVKLQNSGYCKGCPGNLLHKSPKAAWLTDKSLTSHLTLGSNETVNWDCIGCGKTYTRPVCYQTSGLCGRRCAQAHRQAGTLVPPEEWVP